ncbi:MAG TPA: nitroreductase family protein [Steroidobacteraceae bacterium]|nr:nitroreductase family protein [Steroidobacteraceae bacterium]
MTTITNSAIDSLLTRMSHPGSLMTGPSPTDEELQQILGAAQRAADHGRLRPWRFIVVRPERYQEFFDRLAAAATRVQGDPARYRINRDKYELTQRAPLVVVAAAKIDPHHKIAAIEQAFAAAAATQLVLSAAHALRYKAFLFSGAGVFDREFKAALGLGEHDHLIGFICLGKPAGSEKGGPSAEEMIREGLEKTVSEWRP